MATKGLACQEHLLAVDALKSLGRHRISFRLLSFDQEFFLERFLFLWFGYVESDLSVYLLTFFIWQVS